jgi:hypothetical protein
LKSSRLANSDTYITTTWWSLSQDEKHCLETEYDSYIEKVQTQPVDPCANPSETCKIFCKNSGLMQRQIHKNEKLQKLMSYLLHPSEYGYVCTIMLITENY